MKMEKYRRTKYPGDSANTYTRAATGHSRHVPVFCTKELRCDMIFRILQTAHGRFVFIEYFCQKNDLRYCAASLCSRALRYS
jgi:hypothetical protein